MGLKSADFLTSADLCKFVNTVGNNVSVIKAIVFDAASGHFVLFYT
jgi:hypothetical protein